MVRLCPRLCRDFLAEGQGRELVTPYLLIQRGWLRAMFLDVPAQENCFGYPYSLPGSFGMLHLITKAPQPAYARAMGLGTTLNACGSEGLGCGLWFPQAALGSLLVGLESLGEDGEPDHFCLGR